MASAPHSQPPHHVERKGRNALKDLVSGTMGGIAQVIAGHPLDTVKVRLQTQTVVPGHEPEFKGMVDCFRKTMIKEGFGGLYKGAASPLMGAMANNAALFFFYGWASRFLRKDKPTQLSIMQSFWAGGFAGVGGALVETPIDLLKSKIQIQTANRENVYTGVIDAGKQIYSKYGVRALYQGFVSTCMRNLPAFGAYFAAFEATKRPFTTPGEPSPLPVCFLAGGVAGFSFWGLIYPFDVVKTRLQTDASDKAARKYRSILHCWRHIYKHEGIGAFWRGYIPCILRAVVVNGCIFTAVEATKRVVAQI